MTWYAAHIVMSVRLLDGEQEGITLWENIVLIEAESPALAYERAEQRGRSEEGDTQGSFRWGGRPATWAFEGVRKLTECVDAERRPQDMTEVSYIEMSVKSEDMLRKLINGEDAEVEMSGVGTVDEEA